MTLVALFADDEGILLCGDGLRQEQNNPTPKTDTVKVFCTNDRRICFALYGAVPFPDGHGGYLTDLWLADFTAHSIPTDASVRYATVLLEQALKNPAIGNLRSTGGGFLVAGYEGDKASAFEIFCQSVSDEDVSLQVGSWELQSCDFRQHPLLRGEYCDYSVLHRDLGVSFPKIRKEQIGWFDGVVKILASKRKPVGGQTSYIIIERPKATLGHVDAESPLKGSIGPRSPI